MLEQESSLVKISLGLLISKVDRGEIDISEAIERAYEIGKKNSDEEPPTIKFKQARAITLTKQI